MYYIYHYIDPRTMLPFYVGKGKDDRCNDHLFESIETTDNIRKFYKIQSIRTSGLQPIVEKVITDIEDEQVAYSLETAEILKFGRKGFEEGGILMNICLGAHPPNPKGRARSDAHCKALGNAQRGKTRSKESIEKTLATKRKNGTLVSGMSGKNHTEETKQLIREKKTGTVMSDESSAKKSQALKGRPWSDARKKAAITQTKSGPKGPWKHKQKQ